MENVYVKRSDALKQQLLLPVILVILIWTLVELLGRNNYIYIIFSILGIAAIFYTELLAVLPLNNHVIFAYIDNDSIHVFPIIGLNRRVIVIRFSEIDSISKKVNFNGNVYVFEMKNGDTKIISVKKYLGLAYSETVENDFSDLVFFINEEKI